MANPAPPRPPTRLAPPPPAPEDSEGICVARMSPSLSHFAPAFVQVQKALRPVVKNAENPHFKNNFANLAAILEEGLPLLSEHGFALMQFPTNEGGQLGLMSMLIHESGQFISATMPLMVVKQDPQGEGSAITYGRRYAACAILGIRTADDDGNAGSGRAVEARPIRTEPQVVPPKAEGWADAAAEAAAHKAVSEQIKSLYALIGDDHPVRAQVKEHRDNYGWPMVPDALTALSVMVARATPPKAQEGSEQADGSQSAPEAPTPVVEAPSAPGGDHRHPPAAECFWCEKATGKPTVIIGGQDAEHPAQRIHVECETDRQREMESDGG